MARLIKTLATFSLGILAVLSIFLFAPKVLAQENKAVELLRGGASKFAGGAGLQIDGSTPERTVFLPTLIGKVIGNVLSLLGIIFFLLTLYAGILWMFDRGNEAKAAQSVEILKGAIAGLIVILASYALTNLVFDALSVRKGDSTASPDSTTSLEAPPPGYFQSCTVNADCPRGQVCYLNNCT